MSFLNVDFGILFTPFWFWACADKCSDTVQKCGFIDRQQIIINYKQAQQAVRML